MTEPNLKAIRTSPVFRCIFGIDQVKRPTSDLVGGTVVGMAIARHGEVFAGGGSVVDWRPFGCRHAKRIVLGS